jgi:hypothetical protein
MLIFRVDAQREEVFNFVCKIDEWLSKHVSEVTNWKEEYSEHTHTFAGFQDNPSYQAWLNLQKMYEYQYRSLFENQWVGVFPTDKLQTIYCLKSDQWSIFQVSFQSVVNEQGKWVAYPELRDYFYALEIQPQYEYLLPALQEFMDSMQTPVHTLNRIDFLLNPHLDD